MKFPKDEYCVGEVLSHSAFGGANDLLRHLLSASKCNQSMMHDVLDAISALERCRDIMEHINSKTAKINHNANP